MLSRKALEYFYPTDCGAIFCVQCCPASKQRDKSLRRNRVLNFRLPHFEHRNIAYRNKLPPFQPSAPCRKAHYADFFGVDFVCCGIGFYNFHCPLQIVNHCGVVNAIASRAVVKYESRNTFAVQIFSNRFAFIVFTKPIVTAAGRLLPKCLLYLVFRAQIPTTRSVSTYEHFPQFYSLLG
jgi:hypothetical protein